MGARFRFIHAADLHLDSPFRGLTEVPAHVRASLEQAAVDAARQLTEAALAHEVDFIVIAGDLYDGADRSLRAQLTLQREWEKLHAHGVQLFVIHGNHDHLSGSRANLKWPESVHIFGAEEVSVLPAYTRSGELAAYVHGISYGHRAVSENLAKRYRPLDNGIYQIGLLHANVDGDASHDPYSPCSLPELVHAGFHYWALGHIHTRAVLHQEPYIVYSGNTQGRHAKETGAKGCYVVEVSSDLQSSLTFVPLDAVRFETIEVNIDGLATEQSLLDAMEQAVHTASQLHAGRRLMLRLKLTGRTSFHAQLTDAIFTKELLEGIRELVQDSEYSRSGTWTWITSLEARTGAELNLEQLREEDSFAGELYRLSGGLSEDAGARKLFMEEAFSQLMLSTKLRRNLKGMTDERLQLLLTEATEMACGLLVQDKPHTDTGMITNEEDRTK